MHIHVLGSAAGGGFPQWNCNCHNCKRIRSGKFSGQSRTQSSITVSANETDWILFNASPDIRAQLASFPAMQPARGIRDTGISAIVLMDAQIDHTTGLMMLREHRQPLSIYCTELVKQDLTENYPLFTVLEKYCKVDWQPIPISGTFTVPQAEGLEFTAIPLKSEAPPYSPRRHNPQPGDNIGLKVQDIQSGKNFFYAPGLGQIEPSVYNSMRDADCVLVDGTVWSDDEMARAGISPKRARDMGHLQLSGDDGIIATLNQLSKPRKILIHINNTNPILDEDSPEYAYVKQSGIEVAFDGMDFNL